MVFEKGAADITGATLRLAVEEALKRDIAHLVVASNTGKTARLLADEAEKAGYTGRLVCISHAYGYAENGQNEMSGDAKKSLEERGVRVYTSTHVLSGAERGISRRFQGAYPVEIMAHTLRLLSQGVKVCVEISVMALDGGLVPYGEPLIAVGGTNGGADTAAELTPAHASDIFKTRIHEIICKPR